MLWRHEAAAAGFACGMPRTEVLQIITGQQQQTVLVVLLSRLVWPTAGFWAV
jgi:hypothetical protein